jgi:cytochrome c oxidase subunit III
MTRRLRPAVDASDLPDVAFSHHDLAWWGTLGFVVIEGVTLAFCAVVYIYLSRNAESWPPHGTPLPALGYPTAQVALMLLSIAWVRRLSLAARRFDLRGVRIFATGAAILCAAFVTLRLLELTVSLNVRWDSNAYGSAQWLVLGAHAFLLFMQFIETTGIAIAFWFAPVSGRHFSDADDAAFYWYFMVAVWVPLYGLCYLVPRL